MLRSLVNCVTRGVPSLLGSASKSNLKTDLLNGHKITYYQSCGLKVSSTCKDLMDFFDEKKNWGEHTVKVGRAWNVEELRLKSNVDLHKLWFVLLKERNMLLTMEHESAEVNKLFPNPERIDKVKISMQNLETVVRERNKAYHLLETGDTGERKGSFVKDELGLRKWVLEKEYLVPRYMLRARFNRPTTASNIFKLKMAEQMRVKRRQSRNRDRNHVLGLLKRFPNIDRDHLQKTYPHLNIKVLCEYRKADGHFVQE